MVYLIILITISKLNNMMRGDGHTSEFEEVLFVNGEHPVAEVVPISRTARRTLVLFFLYQQHNLPALHNVGNINAFTGQEATAYLNGYGIAPPHNVLARKKVIRTEIGCIAEM